MTATGVPSFETIFRSSPVGMLVTSESGVFLEVNDVALALLGFRREELLGKTSLDTEVMTPEARAAAMERLRGEGRIENADLRLRTKAGDWLEAVVSVYPAHHDGVRVWVTAFFDVTPRKVADVRIRALLDATADSMLVVDRNGTIVHANRCATETFGYTTAELVGASIEMLVPARFTGHRERREAFAASPAARTMGTGLELFARRKDGTEIACEVGLSPLTIGGEPFVLAAVRDVGEAKRTANVLRAVLEHLPNTGIYLVDRDLRIVRAQFPGLGDIIGMPIGDTVLPENRDAVVKLYEATLAGQPSHLEVLHERRYFDVDTVPIRAGDHVTHALAVFHDVSARKAELAHAQALLREVHHRVKNNLQVVSSMLRMQARTAAPQARAAFEDAQARIHTMALLHERLYSSQDFAHIDMGVYLQRLCATLQAAHGTVPAELVLDVRDITLPIDQAVPCGLLVNELITNSLKHAFPAHAPRPGKISISMRRVAAQIVLEVADNGVGMAAAFDLAAVTSLGITLVHDLARQLQGTVTIVSDEGLRVTVRFPGEAA